MCGRRTGDLGPALALLSVGCAHAPLPAPRFVSVTGYEAAAAAYACEDEYELVEVADAGTHAVTRVEGESMGADLRIVSAGETFVVRASLDAPLTVEREGEAPLVLAEPRSFVSALPDGEGALLVVWDEPLSTTAGVIVTRAAILPLVNERWLGFELQAFVRVPDGWVAVSGTHTVRWHVSPSGVVTDVEDLDRLQDVVLLRGSDGRTFASRDEAGITLRVGERAAAVATHPPRGLARPRALLATSDGYWLVWTEEWIDAHFVASLPQLRVARLAPDGTVLGTARTPSRRWIAGVDAWLDGDALRIRLDEHGGSRVVTPVARSCDDALPEPCAPRTFRPGAAPLTGRHWEHEGDRIHYRDGAIDWTLPLAEGQRFMPLFGDDPVVGLLQRDDGVRLLSFDHATGAVLAERALGTPALGSACASPDLEHVALIDDTGATLLDREGHPATRIEGDFEGCALAPLRDGLAWALARTEVESSAGPITTVEFFVLSRDGRSQRAHHDTHQYGRAVALLATDEGAWLGWATLGIESYWTWPLDAEGTPLAEPHRVADLRLFPATALAMTELGPALLWSSTEAEGIVPLCDELEGPGESTLMSVTYPR